MTLCSMHLANSKFVTVLIPCAALALLLAHSPLRAQAPPVPSPPAAQSADALTASESYQQGLAAEQVGNWEGALLSYARASALAPGDRVFRVRLEVARFQVVQQRTERAERELLAGRKDLAIVTLRSALLLDPGYALARNRLEQLEQQQTFAGDLPPLPKASGPPYVAAEPGLRNFDYRGSTRGVYEEVARQFGLVATFDSDLVDRDVRFRLEAVDFKTAMDALEQLTGTFWVSVDSRTLFVTADSTAKRDQYAPEITVSIPLPAAESIDDMTETTRVVRDITGVRRSTLDADSQTLTLRDTPENVELARELLRDIDQPRGELLLDIDILEVDRDAAHRIGITPPSSARAFSLSSDQIRRLQDAQNNGTLLQTLQGIFGAQNPLASGTGLSALLPPVILVGGGNTTFLVTLPGFTADFSQTLSVVRQAQRVLLRVKDGQPGTLFIGDRFPISLALLSESLVPGLNQFNPNLAAGAFPRTDFATGTSPAGVAAADFDGDGDIDLAVANQSDDTVSILLGDGRRDFTEHTDFATADGPVALAAADFDGDDNLDLAVAADPAGVISLLRGNGDGTFEAPVNVAAGNNPSAILAADFNDDDFTDLVVVNRSDDNVSVYLGRGDGTFDPRQNFAADDGPVALAAGDFDNDGNLDLAVANQTADNVSVLEGAGDGTFTTSNFAVGDEPSAVGIGDFDGDGRQDLAVANRADDIIAVFSGDGSGGFSTRTDVETGDGPTALLVADFNGDQVPDVVAANQQDNDVSIFLSLRNGSFLPALRLPTGNAPVAMAAADVNEDDLLDLIVSNTASNTVTVTLNSSVLPVVPDPSTTAYPASEYIDLGLKVTATPRIHPGDEVTLRLQFEMSALTGSDVNGIPIIGNRAVDQVVRLREGETSLLAGMIQSNEFRGVTGFNPFGLLAGTLARHDASDGDTELLIAITPRQIRLGPRPGRTLYAGRGQGPTAAPPGPNQPIDEPTTAPPPGATQPGGQPPGLPPPPVVQPDALPPDIIAPTPGGGDPGPSGAVAPSDR